MPDVKRPGKRSWWLEIPEDLAVAFDLHAAEQMRTRTAELIIAMRKHLGLEAMPSSKPTGPGRPKKHK